MRKNGRNDDIDVLINSQIRVDGGNKSRAERIMETQKIIDVASNPADNPMDDFREQ
jgi:hypothetical protein